MTSISELKLQNNLTIFRTIMKRCKLCKECTEKLNDELEALDDTEEDNQTFNNYVDEMRTGGRTIGLSELGIHTVKSVIPTLVRENVFNSNLVSDIKKIRYTKIHENGRVNDRYSLTRLNDLPPFVDDIYGWSYFTKSQAEKRGNRFTLDTSSNSGIADIIINEINTCLKRAFGAELFDKIGRVKIVFSPSISSNGKIERIIIEQEERTEQRILKKFMDLNNEPAAGYIKFKVDTSDLLIEDFQNHIKKLDKEFYNKGYGFCSIDCTRDYAGSINRSLFLLELEHLGFVKEEELIREVKDQAGKTKINKQKNRE